MNIYLIRMISLLTFFLYIFSCVDYAQGLAVKHTNINPTDMMDTFHTQKKNSY